MKIQKVNVMGMELMQWQYKSCITYFGEEYNWTTLYYITSKEQGKGHATKLLTAAKEYYEDIGREFSGSVALNSKMRNIYQRLEIKENK